MNAIMLVSSAVLANAADQVYLAQASTNSDGSIGTVITVLVVIVLVLAAVYLAQRIR